MTDYWYFDDALADEDVRAREIAKGFAASISKALGSARKLTQYSSPQAVLKEIHQRTTAPRLVILDILNEGEDRISRDRKCGIELGRAICLRWPGVPIIFLTLFDERSEERSAAAKIGSFRDFVTKGHPKTDESLQIAIERLLLVAAAPVLERGRLRVDPTTRSVYWRYRKLQNIRTRSNGVSLLPSQFQPVEIRRLLPSEYGDIDRLKLTPSEYDLIEKLVALTNAGLSPTLVTYDQIRGIRTAMGDDMIYYNMHEVRKKLSLMEKLYNDGKTLTRDEVFQSGNGGYYFVEPKDYSSDTVQNGSPSEDENS